MSFSKVTKASFLTFTSVHESVSEKYMYLYPQGILAWFVHWLIHLSIELSHLSCRDMQAIDNLIMFFCFRPQNDFEN